MVTVRKRQKQGRMLPSGGIQPGDLMVLLLIVRLAKETGLVPTPQTLGERKGISKAGAYCHYKRLAQEGYMSPPGRGKGERWTLKGWSKRKQIQGTFEGQRLRHAIDCASRLEAFHERYGNSQPAGMPEVTPDAVAV
jgi:hypothetical protein